MNELQNFEGNIIDFNEWISQNPDDLNAFNAFAESNLPDVPDDFETLALQINRKNQPINFVAPEGIGEKKVNQYQKTSLSRRYLKKIKRLHSRKYDNPFFNYLSLLSNAVSVDISAVAHKNFNLTFTPNCYITSRNIMKVLTCNSLIKVNKILKGFEKDGLINVAICATEKSTRYYFRFLKYNDYINQEVYNPNDQLQRYAAKEIKDGEGIFYVPSDIVSFFFEKHSTYHGIKDLMLLFYFNSTFNDKNETNEDIKAVASVNFGYCNVNENDNYDLYRVRYFVRSVLATWLNMKPATLTSYIVSLEKAGFIKTSFIRNKGTVITLCNPQNSLFDKTIELSDKAHKAIKTAVLSVIEHGKRLFGFNNLLNRKLSVENLQFSHIDETSPPDCDLSFCAVT